MEFSRCTRAVGPPYARKPAASDRSLKTQQRTAYGLQVTKVVTRNRSYVEVDVDLGELSDRTTYGL
jgi:hypothetical protein